MTRPIVRSEGTLSVIMGLAVRLYPRPEASETTDLVFPEVSNAMAFSIDVMASYKVNLLAGPSIFLKIVGTPAQVSEQPEMVLAYAEDHGAVHINQCASQAEASQVWKIRYSAVATSRALSRGARRC
ncbi:MAG: hypothetical protein OSB69_10415 [Alphaproteobacteria bacterium]|nr:hypothetical protein [Alphaproteobacteria bacterium]